MFGDLADRVRTISVWDAAKDYQISRKWRKPPGWPGTAAEQFTGGVPEIDWIVKDLIPAGICQVNAQQKAGKTTLAVNLVRALLRQVPFLRRFEVNFGPDESVGYINLEMEKQFFLNWIGDLDLTDAEHKRLHIYHSREPGFGRPNLKSKDFVKWFLEWMAEQRITYLVIHTLSRIYIPSEWGRGDPNDTYNAFMDKIEEIKREAPQLRGIFFLHHTGYSEDGAERARGASAMMDRPDVNITYRHSGVQGGQADDNKRELSANGRIEPVKKFEVEYIDGGRELFATGRASLSESKISDEAIRAWRYIAEQNLLYGKEPKKSDLFEALEWDYTGRKSAEFQRFYGYAFNQKWIKREKRGTAQVHQLGDICPPGEMLTLTQLQIQAAALAPGGSGQTTQAPPATQQTNGKG